MTDFEKNDHKVGLYLYHGRKVKIKGGDKDKHEYDNDGHRADHKVGLRLYQGGKVDDHDAVDHCHQRHDTAEK